MRKKKINYSPIMIIMGILIIIGSIVTIATLKGDPEIGECYDNKDNVIIGQRCLHENIETSIESLLILGVLLGFILVVVGIIKSFMIDD